MDIEEPEKKPLQELNFVRVPRAVRHHASQYQSNEMEDENVDPRFSIGHTIKKKFSFMSNESSLQRGMGESFKNYQ